jgi:tRNA-Thr(GGU) m(6)t(6)A37 methyltransferase TsaA
MRQAMTQRMELMKPILSLLVLVLAGVSCASKVKEKPREFTARSIGWVRKAHNQTTIILDREYRAGLMGLEEFSHVYVFYWFDRNDNPEKRSVLQVHPRGNKQNPLTGVFATRSPARPNLIALSLCRIIKIRDNVIEIDDIDALPDTPVLDLKPFIPNSEAVEATVPTWVMSR